MNDIDLWEDIEQLEKLGRKKQAGKLLEIFRYRYIEKDDDKFELAVNEYEQLYGAYD